MIGRISCRGGLFLATAVVLALVQINLTAVSESDPSAARAAGKKPWRGGAKVRPDNPGEFARILAEMKIPADRTTPEYESGYQRLELESAMAAVGFAPNGGPLPWVERGPGNVAGRARAIVVDPDDPTHNTWFIGSVGGGVWKTTNGGTTWIWLTPDFPVLSTSALAMAASNHDILYVGTGESYFSVDVMNGNGMLKSIDRGVTWTHLTSTVDNPAFNNIARILVDPTNPDVVIAATTMSRFKDSVSPRSSIMKSINGGLTWTEVHASTTIGANGRVKKLMQLVADPTDFNILYATVDEAGILKSVNRGDSWAFVNSGITSIPGRFELAISPVDHLRLYASAEGASHSELWISTNGGATWSETIEAGTEPNWLGAQGWYDNTILPHPTDVNVVYVGGVNLARIFLTGVSRTTTFIGSGTHPDHHGLTSINAPGGWRILNTNDGGVSVSTLQDAGFSQLVDGMVTTQFYGGDKRPGASAYAGGTQDNGTWQSDIDPNNLSPWSHIIGGDGYEVSWHFNDPTRIIGGYQYNGLQRSLDGGMTWNSAATSVSPAGLIDNGAGNAPFITKIAKTNASPDFLCAVGRRGVWRSNDFGGTWSLFPIPAGTWGTISSFHCVRISRADPNVVWAGSRMDAPASGNVRILRSTNAAVGFSVVNSYTAVNLGGISGLSTHPTDANTAYVLFSFAGRPKIIRTVDGGVSWTDITGFAGGSPSTNGFPDVAVYDLLVFSNNTNRLWAATEIGLVESLNGGASWALANNGLPNVGIWQLMESEDEVVAATHGRGIWSVTMPELIVGQTFKPLIDKVFQGPGGMITVDMNLRSPYDSTDVLLGGIIVGNLSANVARQDVVFNIPVVTAGTKVIYLRSWKGGVQYTSVTKSIDAFAPQTPVFVYANDFESATTDFAGSLFRIGTEPGFAGSAIHSPHPYADGSSPIYMLTVPIRVAPLDAVLSFDEVALVEPGDPGSVFGDANFWDYVIVEGSRDGCTWTPLAPGWDCRDYPEWETAFNTSAAPDSLLLRRRSINLLNTYSTDDTILVRFRLYADGSVSGWGWIIDNLDIQSLAQAGVDVAAAPAALTLEPGVPNPFRDRTALAFSLPVAGPVTLNVFDLNGRLVRRLVDGVQPAGRQSVTWDGRGDDGAAVANGLYFAQLVNDGRVVKRKLTILK
ncbi:MAG: FlgD immunoglobulin-like domain containing protein [Candidatus Eisenbacteria bacterium]|nr:FlgD immunoglobulin-like domain containing protein [Candidatus Eisenbacteria bacterium]